MHAHSPYCLQCGELTVKAAIHCVFHLVSIDCLWRQHITNLFDPTLPDLTTRKVLATAFKCIFENRTYIPNCNLGLCSLRLITATPSHSARAVHILTLVVFMHMMTIGYKKSTV